MKTIKIGSRLTNEERETIIVYDNINKKWYVDTTLAKHVNKFKKQGWQQTSEFIYEDATVCGGTFEGSARAITIRNAEKKRLSDLQMCNLFDEEDDD
jgi:hypothetical protein